MDSQTLNEYVKVWFKEYPRLVTWKDRDYKVTKVGFHHKYWQGKTLYHVFSVVSDSLFFRLKLNTSNLAWTLEQIADNGI